MSILARPLVYLTCLVLCLVVLTGCERPDPEVVVVVTRVPLALIPPTSPVTAIATTSAGNTVVLPPPTSPVQDTPSALPSYVGTPTPDPTRPGSAPGEAAYQIHTVTAGETLGYIAQFYGSSIEELAQLNTLENTEILYPGQQLRVPGPGASVGQAGASMKIIPDSELVYGPGVRDFNVAAFATSQNGYLLSYQEEVEGTLLDGAQIVQLVANRYSVNPRLLLAALEYRAGWVSSDTPQYGDYPMGRVLAGAEGLYRQLSWAADQLNYGYYGRAEGGLDSFLVGNTIRVAFAPGINDGTAGVQYWLGAGDGVSYEQWLADVGENGFIATYQRLFGSPFAYAVEPLWPAGLSQPAWQLPWPDGETWYFTGGPHGGWASGSAWAALDFVPAGDLLGCYLSDDWITAMADGVVVRSDFGAVVVDTDGDGYMGTGWAITYMHLEARDRVPVGTAVRTGDRLGHPSCEGGFSNGTHVHLARTYNGRWVSADGSIPFQMGGWESRGLGSEYDGVLVRGGTVREACECREELNAITAGP